MADLAEKIKGTGNTLCDHQPQQHRKSVSTKETQIVAFAEKDDTDGEVFERNWVPEQTRRLFTQFTPIEAETDLHKVLTTATHFIKSPAEVETHRKVDLKDAHIR